jgi:glycosyltransferase involved in cell wall biosynthesis
LPIAARIKKLTGAKLIYDAHELETETYERKGVRQAVARIAEKHLLSTVDVMITVSPSIQAWYGERYPGLPIRLVRNVPERHSGSLISQRLRERFGVPDDALLFVYVGALRWGKGVEPALVAFQDSRVRHHLVFLGTGPLQPVVEAASRNCSRIHYLSPVPPGDVLSYVSGADVSLCFTDDSCLSRRFSLPNKLFESLVAGVPVLVSPLPDLSAIVAKYNGGWVVERDEVALREFIVDLTVVAVNRLAADLSARVADLQWANESKELLAAYDIVNRH